MTDIAFRYNFDTMIFRKRNCNVLYCNLHCCNAIVALYCNLFTKCQFSRKIVSCENIMTAVKMKAAHWLCQSNSSEIDQSRGSKYYLEDEIKDRKYIFQSVLHIACLLIPIMYIYRIIPLMLTFYFSLILILLTHLP